MILLLALGCAPKFATPASDPCTGPVLALDEIRSRCPAPGRPIEPERLADPAALAIELAVTPPREPGGEIGVQARVVNITDAPLQLDVVTTERGALPEPALVQLDGFRVQDDVAASCADYVPPGIGGLGVMDLGARSVARVTLPPGGAIVAERSIPARRGLCTCAPTAGGRLGMTCTDAAGSPIDVGEYDLSVSMPIAIVRTDGAGAYTYPYAKARLNLPR